MHGSRRGFCPRCGRSTERPEMPPGEPSDSRRALCDVCYFETFDLVEVPPEIDAEVCPQCGAVYRGNRWVDTGARDVVDVAVEEVGNALRVHADAEDVEWVARPEMVDENTIEVSCRVSAIARNRRVEEDCDVTVEVHRQTCTRCGRIAGGYYESTVQLRALGRDPTTEEAERAIELADEIVAQMAATGDRNAFVSAIEDRPEGLDIKVSTSSIGRKIASRVTDELGGSIESSETLVTRDADGRDVYRVTYAVRLPPFTPGDVVDPDDGKGPVLVTSVRGNLRGLRLETGTTFEIPFGRETAAFRRLGTIDESRETTVVAVPDEQTVQVLDPESYETVSIRQPAYFDPDADTCQVLKIGPELYIVPTDDYGRR